MNRHFPGYFWIYFVGPLLGSLLAAGFYKLLNGMRYQTCNPGQDLCEEEVPQQSGTIPGHYESGSPPLKHARNVSGATAVNHDDRIGGQTIPVQNDNYANAELRQDGISPLGTSTYTTPAYNGSVPVVPAGQAGQAGYAAREYV